MMSGVHRASFPVVHVVTDDTVLARPDVGTVLAALLSAGGPAVAVHLRAPRAAGGIVERLGYELVPVRDDSGGWLVVNDRVDVALAVGADGVQLGHRSLAVAEVRRLAPDLRLGVSVHGVDEIERSGGADWLVAGTIWATPSHVGRPGVGAGQLAVWAGGIDRAVVAIGGVTPERVAGVRRAGAAGVAVIRGIWAARDPIAALDAYLSAWREA